SGPNRPSPTAAGDDRRHSPWPCSLLDSRRGASAAGCRHAPRPAPGDAGRATARLAPASAAAALVARRARTAPALGESRATPPATDRSTNAGRVLAAPRLAPRPAYARPPPPPP